MHFQAQPSSSSSYNQVSNCDLYRAWLDTVEGEALCQQGVKRTKHWFLGVGIIKLYAILSKKLKWSNYTIEFIIDQHLLNKRTFNKVAQSCATTIISFFVFKLP